ncbi:MAG TPA: hypothetical protein VF721_00020 [Pyrinomonadaceae bacterium]|jgi:hypothetical protein
MKKYFPRTLVTLFTFLSGVVFVNFAALFYVNIDLLKSNTVEQNQSAITTYPTDSKGKIEVRFKKYGQIDKQPTLVFEIINHSAEPFKYWSQFEGYAPPFVKFNNQEKEILHCGTGAKEFEIKPGNSLTVEFIAAHFLFKYLDKKGQFQIGFFLKKGGNQYKKIWSEKFSLSDEIKREIIINYSDVYD